MKLGIGIDTGGTCTDGVIYDLEDKKILASAKTPTTKEGKLMKAGSCRSCPPRSSGTASGA